MSYIIITHNGKAHLDEILAISLLAYKFNQLPEKIIRVNPEKAAELITTNQYDNKTFFIDCGLKFNSAKNFFDHHQEKSLGCSALLVFETYFNNLFDTQLHDYIKLVSEVDTKGPNSLEDFKINSKSINYFSFSQKILVKQFEDNPLLITSIFYEGIKSIIEFDYDKNLAKSWFNKDNNFKIEKIYDINILVYNNPPPINLARAVKSIDSEIVDDNNIHVIYGFDKEDNRIRTLFRTLQADSIIDFCQSKVEKLIFCHNSGFLLKFIPQTDTEWYNIVKESIRDDKKS